MNNVIDTDTKDPSTVFSFTAPASGENPFVKLPTATTVIVPTSDSLSMSVVTPPSGGFITIPSAQPKSASGGLPKHSVKPMVGEKSRNTGGPRPHEDKSEPSKGHYSSKKEMKMAACEVCGEYHKGLHCPKEKEKTRQAYERREWSRSVSRGARCQLCDKEGHVARDCYQFTKYKTKDKKKEKEMVVCSYCNKRGHHVDVCKQVPEGSDRRRDSSRGRTHDRAKMDRNALSDIRMGPPVQSGARMENELQPLRQPDNSANEREQALEDERRRAIVAAVLDALRGAPAMVGAERDRLQLHVDERPRVDPAVVVEEQAPAVVNPQIVRGPLGFINAMNSIAVYVTSEESPIVREMTKRGIRTKVVPGNHDLQQHPISAAMRKVMTARTFAILYNGAKRNCLDIYGSARDESIVEKGNRGLEGPDLFHLTYRYNAKISPTDVIRNLANRDDHFEHDYDCFFMCDVYAYGTDPFNLAVVHDYLDGAANKTFAWLGHRFWGAAGVSCNEAVWFRNKENKIIFSSDSAAALYAKHDPCDWLWVLNQGECDGTRYMWTVSQAVEDWIIVLFSVQGDIPPGEITHDNMPNHYYHLGHSPRDGSGKFDWILNVIYQIEALNFVRPYFFEKRVVLVIESLLQECMDFLRARQRTRLVFITYASQVSAQLDHNPLVSKLRRVFPLEARHLVSDTIAVGWVTGITEQRKSLQEMTASSSAECRQINAAYRSLDTTIDPPGFQFPWLIFIPLVLAYFGGAMYWTGSLWKGLMERQISGVLLLTMMVVWYLFTKQTRGANWWWDMGGQREWQTAILSPIVEDVVLIEYPQLWIIASAFFCCYSLIPWRMKRQGICKVEYNWKTYSAVFWRTCEMMIFKQLSYNYGFCMIFFHIAWDLMAWYRPHLRDGKLEEFLDWVHYWYESSWSHRHYVEEHTVALINFTEDEWQVARQDGYVAEPNCDINQNINVSGRLEKAAIESSFYLINPTQVPGYYPRRSNHNLLMAVYERLLAEPPGTGMGIWRSIYQMIPYLCATDMHIPVAWDPDGSQLDWMNAQKGLASVRAKQAHESYMNTAWTDLELYEPTTFMAKTDEMLLRYNKDQAEMKVRAICTVNAKVQYLVGPWIRLVSHALKEKWSMEGCRVSQNPVFLTLGSGRTDDELSEWANRCMLLPEGYVQILVSGDDSLVAVSRNGGLDLWEGDISMCDQSTTECALDFEYAVLLACGMPPDRVRILKRLSRGKIIVRGVQPGPKLVLNLQDSPTRLTGGPDTSIGNSIVVGSVWGHYFDQTAAVSKTSIEVFFRCFGFKVKVKEWKDISDATFLKGTWYRLHNGDYRWGPLPSRLLKIGKSKDNPQQTYGARDISLTRSEAALIHLSMQAKSLAKFFLPCMLREYVAKYWGRPLWMPNLEDELEYPSTWQARWERVVQRGVYESVTAARTEAYGWDVDEDNMRLQMMKRYSISSEQIDTCIDLLMASQPFQLMQHPVFYRMALVDYN